MLPKTMCYHFTLPMIASPRSIAPTAHPLLSLALRASLSSALLHRTLHPSVLAVGRFPYLQYLLYGAVIE
jgi:hypothetical protein